MENKISRYKNFGSLPVEPIDTDDFNNLNNDLQIERSTVSKIQMDITSKLEELDERGKNIFGTTIMRKADRALLRQVDEARSKTVEIILSSRNECLSVVSETMVRYTKSLANTLVMTLETSNAVALDGHFGEAKLQLTEKLESLNRRFVALLNEKEKEIESASETIKPMLKDQGLILMNSWMNDYEKIITDFSAIRDRKFK